jgi:simple sugar transport system ATP-binding protein
VIVLGCNDVRVDFGTTVALDGVSLSWEEAGAIHAVAGQNGAGKTTLCRVLAGLIRAERGEVIVEGTAYPATAQGRRREGVELVHQTFALPPQFTVAEALQLFRPGTARGGLFQRGRMERRWADQLEELGFTVSPKVLIRDLAPEQQQAVEITRALSSGSRVIVLDEPTAVLPPEAIAGLFDRLRALAAQGITFLVVMHKLRQVRELAGTVAVLAGGKVVLPPTAMGTIDDDEIARLIMGASSEQVVTGASAVAMGLADAPEGLTGATASGNATSVESGGLPGRDQRDTSEAAVLRVQDVSVSSVEGRRGLRSFSVEVFPGEIVGIAGVEGNGQQALVDVVVGLLAPREGRVVLGGADASGLRIAARRRLGLRYIPADRQSRAVSLSSSLWVNAMAAPVSSGYGVSGVVRRGFLSERRLRKRGEERLQRWQVRYAASDQAMRELSGGNLQRVVLAREVDDDARVIVAEQPTQGLDLGGTELVWEALRRARRQGVGVLLVSSDLDELFALSDRIVVILDGERVEELRPPYDRTMLGHAMVVGAAS